MENLAVRLTLALLVVFGLWSGGRLSWSQAQTGEACPILGDLVPACYVALAGYLLMAVAVAKLMISASTSLKHLFWGGLFLAGSLALLGSVLELVRGEICPKAFGWLPMCYVSLAFIVAIGILYRQIEATPDEGKLSK